MPLGARHRDATLRWANDAALMRLLDRSAPVSEAEHQSWFAALAARTDCAYFAIERCEDNRHVGNVWLWDINPRHRRAEVRIVVGDGSAVGQGLGSAAISLIKRYAFDRLNLHKLSAQVLAFNPRAKRAFEKAGFEVEGLLKDDRCVGGAHVDVWVLGVKR